jgi:uncharacterized protein (TIGR03435 family)
MLVIVGAILCLVGWTRLFSLALLAQEAPAPAFEVASIKANKSGINGKLGMGFQPGRMTARNYSLKELVQGAFGVDANQIIGGPNWIGADRFDVEAKGAFTLAGFLPNADGNAGVAYQMLQSLLRERFRLVVHSESRQRPIYALTLAIDGKLGPRLLRSGVDCQAVLDAIVKSGRPPAPPIPGQGSPCSGRSGPGSFTANAMTMSQMATTLAPYTDRAVRDQTGMTGTFDWVLEWTPTPGEYAGPGPSDGVDRSSGSGPSLFTALQEQLGLRLESTRGPVDVLVIDHVEKPTED